MIPASGPATDLVGQALAALGRRGPDRPAEPVEPGVRIEADQAEGVLALLRHHPDLRFDQLLDLTAMDGAGLGSGHGCDLVYQLRSLELGHRLQVSAAVRADRGPATACRCWPGAAWPEREVGEMLGVEFAGTKGGGRLFTPPGLACPPLRRESPLEGDVAGPDRAADPGPSPDEPGAGADLVLGPVGGPGFQFRLRLELVDEVVAGAAVEPGYLHSGLEKLAESLGYHQLPSVLERVAGPDPVAAGLAVVLAAEALLGVEVPPRARRLRILCAELSRLQSHLSWLVRQARAAGFDQAAAVAADVAEAVADLSQGLTGRRAPFDVLRVGGVTIDAPDGLASAVSACLAEVRAGLRQVRGLWLASRAWQRRVQGRAVLGAGEAAAWGVTGPALRAAGIGEDVRRSRPYGGYEELDFEVAAGASGDLADRCGVRVAEMEQGACILEQVSADLPAGPVAVDDARISSPAPGPGWTSAESVIHHAELWMSGHGLRPTAGARVYLPVEGAGGELAVYLVSDGTACPYRLHLRSPSLMHAQVMPRLLAGLGLDEVVPAAVSLDVCAAEMDR